VTSAPATTGAAPHTPPVLDTARLTLVLAQPALAAEHVAFFTRNDAHFRPWDPPRPRGLLTVDYWLQQLARSQAEFEAGTAVRLVALRKAAPSMMVGRINLTQIARGPFQSAMLGYAIDAAHEGQGLMREALFAVIGYAFGELRLHRLEANVRPENLRSLRSLAALGFERTGLARRYLFIDGAWRDHVQYQRIIESAPMNLNQAA
jgi:ribosomal-protein-alanine N-acetyltransferase